MLVYKGMRWTLPVSVLLFLGALSLLGWGPPIWQSWVVSALLGSSLLLQVLRYRGKARAFERELQSGLQVAFMQHLQKEFKTKRKDRKILAKAVEELQDDD